MSLINLKKELAAKANPSKAKLLQGFFKTGKGEYGEGDKFLGIIVPVQRQIAMRYLILGLSDLRALLSSKIHEHRFTALEILAEKYRRAVTDKQRQTLVNFYLTNSTKINNWDLVDTSAPYILGEHLAVQSISAKSESEKCKDLLLKLAKSKNLWQRRIAIVSTFAFIKRGEFAPTLAVSAQLLSDPHDLIHKAVGWALREIGKKSLQTEEQFLSKHIKKIPRTALRYAIERFPEKKRKAYLAKPESKTTK